MSNEVNILFVDDDAQVLRGIRRLLSFVGHDWNVTFTESGSEALACMQTKNIDVIISDMRMPGMDGATLLNIVKEKYPQIIRIALSGQTSKNAILKTVGPVHQYLSKPCNADTLESTIVRVCSLRGFLTNKKLQSLISQLESLPILSSVFTDLMETLHSEDVSIKNVGEIISQDIGMSAKILQLVNSAFFGITQPVSDITHAVILLGLETIKSLVISVKIFSQFDKIELENFSLRSLWDHSLTVGNWAKLIAQTQNADQKIIDDALLAGMMHDVGKLVLAGKMPHEYQNVLTLANKEKIPIVDAEKQIIDATHAEVGAYLLGLWGFSNSLIETLSFHHRPRDAATQKFTALTAVHVANRLAHESSLLNHPHETASPLDEIYLDQLNLSDRLPLWRETCLEKIMATP